MRIAVFSDIHGNVSAWESVMKDCAEEDFSGVILLGDLIDYGMRSNDIISRVRSLDEKIRDLAEDDDGSIRFTMEELSVILDMDADEIRSVMKLIGDA